MRKFCLIYNEIFKSNVENIDQIFYIQFNGKELLEYSEKYFNKRIEHSCVKHYYMRRKIFYIIVGLVFGILISSIFKYL